MNAGFSKIPALGLIAVVVALTLFIWPKPALADFLDDALEAIDQAEPSLDLETWKDIYEQCAHSDDLEACMETIATKKGGLDSGNVQEVMNIFNDLENKDYSKLLKDSSQTVACAVANLLTGIDICGALEDVYNDAKAVVDWFANLFGGCSGNACGGVPLGTVTSAGSCAPGTQQVPNLPQCQPGAPKPFPDYCSKYDVNSPCDTFPCKVTCSYCPFGQAKVNGSCSFCPGKTTTNNSQSSDKLCWSIGGDNPSFPTPDGSRCIANSGWGQTLCCKPGQIASSYGQCAPACPSGQIFDKSSNACTPCAPGTKPKYSDSTTSVGTCVPACDIGSVFNLNQAACQKCDNGTYAIYHDLKTSSVGVCSQCTHGMVSAAKGAACACPSGYAQQQGMNSQCTICSANTYQNFSICSACPSNESSAPGSTFCKKLTCGTGMHADNHKCISNKPTLPNALLPGDGAVTAPRERRVIGTPPSGTPEQSNRIEHLPSRCPPLSKWTGAVCIGPRGKHFCPQGMFMRRDSCVAGQTASPCPPLSTWTGLVCIGPRGKHFCPQGMTMRDDVCAN